LHEYQRKGVAERAFRKPLILKGTILGCFRLAKEEKAAPKRKAGASSRTPDGTIYKTYGIADRPTVKKKL
jgi:hypothetical protein